MRSPSQPTFLVASLLHSIDSSGARRGRDRRARFSSSSRRPGSQAPPFTCRRRRPVFAAVQRMRSSAGLSSPILRSTPSASTWPTAKPRDAANGTVNREGEYCSRCCGRRSSAAGTT
jgi:hypothetical protein